MIKFDDNLRDAKQQMKAARDTAKTHKKTIIDYLVRTKRTRIEGIKGGTQYLVCTEKILKNRPTAEQMQAKLSEMLSKGISDPIAIMGELQVCGGTRTEHRLSRRTMRMNAAVVSSIIERVAASGGVVAADVQAMVMAQAAATAPIATVSSGLKRRSGSKSKGTRAKKAVSFADGCVNVTGKK